MVKIINIYSLPRSGSTFLQSVIGSDERVVTYPESWFFLLLSSIFCNDNIKIESNFSYKDAVLAFNEFMKVGGVDSVDFKNEIVEIILNKLIDKKNNQGGEYFFLEKTPRNYLCYSLIESYGNVKSLVLLRNPLYIYSSMKKTWWKNRLWLHHHFIDLTVGVEKINELVLMGLPIVKYEDVCQLDQIDIINLINEKVNLDLSYKSGAYRNTLVELKKGSMGDPKIRKVDFSNEDKVFLCSFVEYLVLKKLYNKYWKGTYIDKFYPNIFGNVKVTWKGCFKDAMFFLISSFSRWIGLVNLSKRIKEKTHVKMD